jgi:very-short-patch-repair endonuclease
MTEVDEIAYDIKLEEGKCITEELRRAGFYVFRFTEEEVLTNIQGVAMEIEGII